ncbi:MAG: hypothetical protein JXA74_04470, partial [Anaerolineae bacterium]|nr:hypothetical protein [Anaerolineae bacterium]
GDSPPTAPEPSYPLTATFADGIRLTGYDLEAASDEGLSVSLHWEALGEVLRDYTVFVHLLSAEGELATQHDGPPPLPTGLWVPDLRLVSVHSLALPADLAPGTYNLRVGLYHWPDLKRQAVLSAGALDASGDALCIGQLRLGEGQTPGGLIPCQ